MMGSVAQFERDLIRQRQGEGIAEARERGGCTGRPHSMDSMKVRELRNAALAGTPNAHDAREDGISRSARYRCLDTPMFQLEGPTQARPTG
ncbi:hypothetical protein DWV08_16600 [Brachybacterium saurashtrense]|uniref:Resolvase/invertase-type recombinase catalytic domain-containing protein n=2 Tax=Brachybacterium saurashtrense TaxID=556288 RepID=A0ABN5MWD5_9MICO|nr:hypothetical protein DWV08_16600 [Brachybacterium saurashtrense]